jgi:hypothetical protein
MTTTLAMAIPIEEAQKVAKGAADTIIASIGEALIGHKHTLCEKMPTADLAVAIDSMKLDERYHNHLEAAFVAWLAENHLLIPPSEPPTNR